MYFWPSACETFIDKQQDIKLSSLNPADIYENLSDVFGPVDFDTTCPCWHHDKDSLYDINQIQITQNLFAFIGNAVYNEQSFEKGYMVFGSLWCQYLLTELKINSFLIG